MINTVLSQGKSAHVQLTSGEHAYNTHASGIYVNNLNMTASGSQTPRCPFVPKPKVTPVIPVTLPPPVIVPASLSSVGINVAAGFATGLFVGIGLGALALGSYWLYTRMNLKKQPPTQEKIALITQKERNDEKNLDKEMNDEKDKQCSALLNIPNASQSVDNPESLIYPRHLKMHVGGKRVKPLSIEVLCDWAE